MASRFRSPAEQEVQDYLDQVAAGQAGQSPRDQTLARSRDPRLQRIGQRNMADRAADNLANAEDAARQQEADRKAKEVETRRMEKEAAQTAEAQRARSVREGAALGQKTIPDIATGKLTIATHEDGSPVYNVGAVSKPFLAEQPDAAAAPASMLGQADGSLGATGGTTTAVPAQTFRNDRGKTKTVPLETKTDPKTGAITYTGKDSFGAPMQTQIGIDPQIAQKQQRLGRLEQEKAQNDLRRIQLGQARTVFEPRWQPTKAGYLAAKSKFEGLANNYVREPNPKPGQPARWGTIGGNGMWQPILAPERNDKFQAWQKDMADAKANLDRATKAYQPAAQYHENLTKQERAARLQWLENRAEKIRIENNLPDDDGGISMHLAQQEDPSIGNPYEDAVSEVSGSDGSAQPSADPVTGIPATEPQATEPTGQGAPAPQTPAVQDAFKSLQGLQGVTVEPLKGFTALNRNGRWIASLETNDIGESIVTLKDEARSQEDISQIVRDTDRGIPIYLRDNRDRPKASEEAAKVAMAFRTLNDPALAGDGQRIARTLASQGLDPVSIRRAVDNGEMSVQSGKVLLKNIWGDSLEVPKFDDPANFQAWLDRKTKDADTALQDTYGNPALKDQNAPGRAYQKATSKDGIPGITSDFSLDAQKSIKLDYAKDWAKQNAGKPGVSRADIKANYEKAVANNSGKVTSGANYMRDLLVNDVLGSMVGMGVGIGGDLASAEVAMLGNADAKKILAESMRLRNRDWANWKNAAGRNIKAWTTPEGRATAQTLNTSLDRLQRTLDEEADQPNPDKARIDAAELAVRDAALAMHNLNPDTAWPVTSENLDPSKDSALGTALADYQATADPRSFALYRERLLMNNGRRQLSAEMQQRNAPYGGGFLGSVAQARNAGWQEIGSEIIADAAALVTAGGSKAIQAGLKATGAVGKAARVEAAANRISRGLEAAWNAGIKRGTLQKPLTWLDKTQNFGVRTLQGMGGEGGEEAVVSIGSDSPTPLQDFAVGMLGAVTLAPAQMVAESIRPGAGTTPTPITPQIARANETFATRYNAENAKTAGFEPVTTEQVQAARGFINTGEREQAINTIAQAVNDHGQIQGDDEASTGQRAQLRQQVAQTTAQLVVRQDDAIQAAQAVAAVPEPAKRTFYTGIAKVAAGNADQLTGNEMKAIQGAKTEAGADYFEQIPQPDGTFREQLTTEAVDELRTTMPAVARLAGASTPTPTAQSNVQTPPPQIEPTQAQVQPAAALPQEPGATGMGTEVPGSGGAAPSGAGEPGPVRSAEIPTNPQESIGSNPQTSQPVGVQSELQPENAKTDAVLDPATDPFEPTADPFEPTADDADAILAELEAQAAAEQNPQDNDQEQIRARVQQAITNGNPVSVEDATASGLEIPSTYHRVGNTYRPKESVPVRRPYQPQDLQSARSMAEELIVELESAIPGIRGRISIGKPMANPSGGIVTQLNGDIQIIPEDIAGMISTEGFEATKREIINGIIRHETVHTAQLELVRKKWKDSNSTQSFAMFLMEFYGGIYNDLLETPEVIEIAKQIYDGKPLDEKGASSWDNIEADYLKAAELVRMLIEAKLDPAKYEEFSELYRAIIKNKPKSLINLLRDLIEQMKGWVNGATGQLAESVQQHINEVEALYRELTQQSPAQAAEPTGTATEGTAPAEGNGGGASVSSEKSSTQINLPEPLANQIRKFAAKIPEAELYTAEEGYGREDEIHVTVLYGLTSDTAEQATQALQGFGPIDYKLGKLNLFENDKYDVLKIDVISPDLHRANKTLRDSVDFENDYPDYKPHVTVAYLKKGEGAKYAGNPVFAGAKATSDEVLHSGKDRSKTPISTVSNGAETPDTPTAASTPESVETASEKPAKPRRQIDSPARREAFRLLNAPDTQLTTINKIIGSVGKIQAPPIGMLRLIKNQSKARKLTEKQMEMLRRWTDFSAYMPKASFGTTASGKVAQELHGMIFTTGESNATLDDWAKALEETSSGPVTNDEALIAVMSELDRVAKGIKSANPMEVENPTAEDVARAEAQNREAMDQAEIEQQQADNFEAANTADNGGKPISVEDFTPKMIGQVVTVDGENLKIVDVEVNSLGMVEAVVLEDGARFGQQVLEDGEVVYVEVDSQTTDLVETGSKLVGGAKPAPASAMDRKNADSKELFADDGGFQLAQQTTQDGDKIAAERKAKEEAAAAQDAAQSKLFASPSNEQDKKYLSAVKSGDMELAQRMVDDAAKTAGYDSEFMMFHGTTHDFDTFTKERANIENDFGKGFYFTSEKEDVLENYAGIGPDLTSRIEREAERLESNEDMPREKALKEAKKRLAGKKPRAIKAYLKLENPVRVGGGNETFFDYSESYDEETDEYGDPGGKLVDLVEAIQRIAWMYDDVDTDAAAQAAYEAAMDNEGIGASELIDVLKGENGGLVYAQDENGDLASSEIIREAFESIGFDGIEDYTVDEKFGSSRRVGKQMLGINPDTVHKIAFRSNQIKSAEPVTKFKGRIIPLSERFDSTKDSILYSSPTQQAPAFYSQLARTLEAKMPKAAPPQQVIQIAASGAKSEEIKWSGLVPKLQSMGPKVDKAELLAWLADEGSVRFEEVVIADNAAKHQELRDALTKAEEAENEARRQAWDALEAAGASRVQQLNIVDNVGTFSNTNGRDYSEALTAANMFAPDFDWDSLSDLAEARREAKAAFEESRETNAQFSQYTLLGGSNYREVVLAMPSEARAKTLDEAFEMWKVDARAGKRGQYTEAEINAMRLDDVRENLISDYLTPPRADYTSSHFPDVPNYVAHMRLNEREDSQGKPGLFIEEIQSDRHQAGRKKGYDGDARLKPNWQIRKVTKSDDLSRTVGNDYINVGDYAAFMDGEAILGLVATTEREAFAELQNIEEEAGEFTSETSAFEKYKGIPDAPFRNDWPLALFKRALRDAVASGKEWIGWTTGSTQADRFDLSKQIDRIAYDDAKGQLMAWRKGTQEMSLPDIRETVPMEKVGDYIGKEAAQKLAEAKPKNGVRSLVGMELKIGGEGMRGFYDNMLPKEIGKYVKQWGARVMKSEITTTEGGGRSVNQILREDFGYRNLLQEEVPPAAREQARKIAEDERKNGRTTPIWRIDITDAMRKGVQTQGQALFSSPTRRDTGTPDLFAAASAPDAKAKLGDVKVGRVHALNAYRALTAKKAKVGLSAAEEQQLLDVEQALGQKLAFDMEGVKGEAPATVKDSLQVQPAPKAIRGSIGGQQDLMMGGETLKGGQMTLFSSQSPNPEFVRLRKVLGETLTKKPTEHVYENTVETRPEIQKFLEAYQLDAVTPTDMELDAADIERVSGAQIVFIRPRTSNSFESANSLTIPRIIAINANSEAASVGYMIAHEMAHVAQKASNAPTGPILAKMQELISQDELKALRQFLVSKGYDPIPQLITAEIHAHLVGDAVTNSNTLALPMLLRSSEVKSALVEYFDSLPRLEPDAQPGQYFSEPGMLFSSVTPEQDREYLAAVESGDMETAQRMVDEAAKAAGYDIGPLFHGSPYKEITRFKRGFWTSDPDRAAGYLSLSGQGKVYRAYLKITRPYKVHSENTWLFHKIGYEGKKGDFHDGAITDGTYDAPTVAVVVDPSQIKSADPVTYDSNGNVIPLSQRFNPASESILYSSPSGGKRVDPLLAAIKKLITEPEKKAETFARMNNLVNGIRRRFDNARLKKEFSKQGVDAARYTQIRDVAILEAVAKSLPPEIRGKLIGSFRRLDELKTERGREKYLLKMLPKIEAALETHLQKLYRKDIRKVLDKSKPRPNESRNLRGRIGAVGHAIAKQATDAMTMEPDEALAAAAALRDKIEQADDMDFDTFEEMEGKAMAMELFGDYENADSARLEKALEFLKNVYAESRDQWLEVLKERKAKKESDIESLREAIKAPEFITSEMLAAAKKKSDKITHKFADSMLEWISSYEQILGRLKENTTDPKAIAWVDEQTAKLRDARGQYDDHLEAERQALETAMEDIFNTRKGWIGKFQLDPILHELSTRRDDHGITVLEGVKNEPIIVPKHIAESLIRREVSAYDHNGKRYEITSQDMPALTEAWERFEELPDEVQAKKRVITFTRHISAGRRNNIGAYSQLELLKEWLAMRQTDLAKKYASRGWDETTMEELERALKPEVKRLGLWMVDRLESQRAELDAKHREEYGIGMDMVDNYFPALFEAAQNQESTLSTDGTDTNVRAKTASGLKSRVAHNARPRQMNALSVFLSNRAQIHYFMTHATPLREMLGTFRSTKSNERMRVVFGDNYVRNLGRELKLIETNGMLQADGVLEAEKFMRKVQSGYALGILGLKLSTLAINTTAVLNTALGVPAAKLVKGFTPEYIGDVRRFFDTPAIRRRLKHGTSHEVRVAAQGGIGSHPLAAGSRRLAQTSLEAINWWDTFSNGILGAAAYRAALEEARAAGLTEEQATRRAEQEIDRLSATVMQPNNLLSRSIGEAQFSQHPIGGLMFMFATEPRKNIAIGIYAMRKLLTGKGPMSAGMAAQQVITLALFYSALGYMIRSAYQAAFNAGDDEPEEMMKRLHTRMTDAKGWTNSLMTEHLKGIPLIGEAMGRFITGAVNEAEFIKGERIKQFDASPNPLNRAVRSAFDAAAIADDKLSPEQKAEQVISAIQGSIGMLPETAVLSQAGNVAKDALGLLTSNGMELSQEEKIRRMKKRFNKFKSQLPSAKTEDGRQDPEIQMQRDQQQVEYLQGVMNSLMPEDRKALFEALASKNLINEDVKAAISE